MNDEIYNQPINFQGRPPSEENCTSREADLGSQNLGRANNDSRPF